MALILNRDLDGHGNCNADGKYVPLTKVNRPDGTTALVRTGGTHLRLGTAKADGIRVRVAALGGVSNGPDPQPRPRSHPGLEP